MEENFSVLVVKEDGRLDYSGETKLNRSEILEKATIGVIARASDAFLLRSKGWFVLMGNKPKEHGPSPILPIVGEKLNWRFYIHKNHLQLVYLSDFSSVEKDE